MSLCLNEETLQAYFDGEIAPDAAVAVVTHLTSCPDCADRALEVELALVLIENAFDDELPESVPTANLRARIEDALVERSSSAAPSPSAVLFFRRLLDSLAARVQTIDLFPRRLGLAAAIVVVAIVLAAGLAVRLWRSATPKNDVVQQGGANAPSRISPDRPKPLEQRALEQRADGDKPEEPRRARRDDRVAYGIKPKPGRIEPADRTEPSPAISIARRSKPSRNATLRNPETSEHLMLTQLLLRSFRNAPSEEGAADIDLAYEKRLSRELLSKNRLLRRSAENKEDSRAEELLSHIEPLLLDIANLPDKPTQDEVRSVKELIREQKIIATLQIYSAREVRSPAFRRRKTAVPLNSFNPKPSA
jgi:anti-sigma factor RsiW